MIAHIVHFNRKTQSVTHFLPQWDVVTSSTLCLFIGPILLIAFHYTETSLVCVFCLCCSLSKFHQFELSWSIVLKFSMNCVFTFEGEHDFWFLHLTTFKARFLHLRLEFVLHLRLMKFLQLRVVSTNEINFFTFAVDFFTFVVDFYIMKFFYIWGCNIPPAKFFQ